MKLLLSGESLGIVLWDGDIVLGYSDGNIRWIEVCQISEFGAY